MGYIFGVHSINASQFNERFDERFGGFFLSKGESNSSITTVGVKKDIEKNHGGKSGK